MSADLQDSGKWAELYMYVDNNDDDDDDDNDDDKESAWIRVLSGQKIMAVLSSSDGH